jgi:hypothetical protein
MAMAVLADLARLACLVGLGPQLSVALGQVNLGAKCSASYFNSKNFRKVQKLVKFIVYSLFIRKL